MEKTVADFGLSHEEAERVKAAQKRRAAIDPGCEKLTPEEFVNWHPVGGMSWEERAARMAEAGVTDPETIEVQAPHGARNALAQVLP